jgi:hypothetical protein
VKATPIIVTLLVCITALMVAHMVTEGRRYNVVSVGAGSGGSNDASGDTDFRSYLLDRKTGKVWFLAHAKAGFYEEPATRIECHDFPMTEKEFGCAELPPPVAVPTK